MDKIINLKTIQWFTATCLLLILLWRLFVGDWPITLLQILLAGLAIAITLKPELFWRKKSGQNKIIGGE